MQGVFEHQATGDPMEDWRQRVIEFKADMAPYPSHRYSGRGIVMAAGGRRYFVNAYINIRVIRDTHGCHLPIELFYPGPDAIPQLVASYMERTFSNVRFIDVYDVHDMRLGANTPNVAPTLRKGYPLKAFATLLSSFKEILFLDADSYPIEHPDVAFHFHQYTETGALFWPDICNFYSIRPKAYDVLGIDRPSHGPVLGDNEPFRWSSQCAEGQPQEIETGQFVVDKERVWSGLLMTVFINWHSAFFMTEIIHGDKNTFKLGFDSTATPYAIVTKPLYYQGRAATQIQDGTLFFCGNGISQAHPITGKPLFIHRIFAKFGDWPVLDYLALHPVPRAWTHIAQQHPDQPWGVILRGADGVVSEPNRPLDVWLPKTTSQQVCTYPHSVDAKIEVAPMNMQHLEDEILRYLKEGTSLHFIPKTPDHCELDREFFCRHP